jgi:hypothetical protein
MPGQTGKDILDVLSSALDPFCGYETSITSEMWESAPDKVVLRLDAPGLMLGVVDRLWIELERGNLLGVTVPSLCAH